MPFATFADPTVAIEPPPQPWDFDWALSSREVTDPFGVMFNTPDVGAAAPSPASKSWTDIAQDVGQSFVRDLAGAISGKVTGYNPSDPASAARLAAATKAQQDAEQSKLFLIVGGVGLAVVLGALVLRKGK